ncbi:MAG: cell envelope integrity protein TolA [Thermoanaerobaculum sp.]|nr:cell envelope integrity protein TolA [Thermoanaerobaculum sp.]MCX7895977.1 cell envelope integrity protein TolA [Thermoanaerobaculum sp.]MDW7966642.1 cell envelope integrity protein TolA [Thermoanaerobaculum sp.]
MRDPVSDELARRAAEPLPWRSALVIATLVHLVALSALLVATRPDRKALSLPTVRVHLAPLTAVPASSPSPQVPAGKPAKADQTAAPAPPRKALARSSPNPKPEPKAGKAAPSAAQGPVGDDAQKETPALASGATGSGLTLAPDSEQGPAFPYSYYLQRVLAAIEENWFKPPAPPGTRCRVRCHIARSGQLREVGLEEPSGHGAFDRAALRAVYAAAPFPPLPQGFSGQELVMHLEFIQ